jgi:hypothetical protein
MVNIAANTSPSQGKLEPAFDVRVSRIMSFRLSKFLAVAASIAIWGPGFIDPAAAANIKTTTFNFNNIGSGGTTSQNASYKTIQSYMTTELQKMYAPGLVTVTGGIGQQGTSSYAGEGYVVGPVNGTAHPLTLANTNNSPSPNTYNVAQWDGFNNTTNLPTLNTTEGFIKNCTSVDPGLSSGPTYATGCSGTSPDIFIDFHGLKITSLSFDFEIFPDGTCPSLSNCGGGANLPDLKLWTGDNGTGTPLGTWLGIVPNTTTLYDFSINHPSGAGETAPQLLGVASYSNLNISTLDFMDWPVTIGIDNLVITYSTPEPASIAIFAFGFVGLATIARRKRARWALLVGNTKQG